MNNFFIETEYIETDKLHLISIGIVDESGKNKFYAISSEFNAEGVNDRTMKNVIHTLSPTVERQSLEDIMKGIVNYFNYTTDQPLFGEGSLENRITLWSYKPEHTWVLFSSLFGGVFNMPKEILNTCKNLKQEMMHVKLPKKYVPDHPVVNKSTLTGAEWSRELWRKVTEYELHKVNKAIVQEYQYLKDELELALRSYEIQFKKMNSGTNVSLHLSLNKQATPTHKDYTHKTTLSLTLKENGLSRVLCSKTFNHRSHAQFEAEYDWGLLLYREMMYEIVGGCISYVIICAEAEKLRKQQEGNG